MVSASRTQSGSWSTGEEPGSWRLYLPFYSYNLKEPSEPVFRKWSDLSGQYSAMSCICAKRSKFRTFWNSMVNFCVHGGVIAWAEISCNTLCVVNWIQSLSCYVRNAKCTPPITRLRNCMFLSSRRKCLDDKHLVWLVKMTSLLSCNHFRECTLCRPLNSKMCYWKAFSGCTFKHELKSMQDIFSLRKEFESSLWDGCAKAHRDNIESPWHE